MTTNRRYTKRQKLATVMAAEMSTVAQAAKAIGAPESTVRYWMDDPSFAEFRAKTRDDMVEGTALLAHRILGRISETLDQFEPRDLTILFGVMVDKAQLLSGNATGRLETRDLSGSLSDADITEAIRAAEDYTRAGHSGTAEATPGETAG
jgi:hypothetical protein